MIFRVFDDGLGFRYELPEQPNLGEFAIDAEALQAAAIADMGNGTGVSPDHLTAIVRALRPTVLVGPTATAGTFGEAMVRALAAGVPHPLALPP